MLAHPLLMVVYLSISLEDLSRCPLCGWDVFLAGESTLALRQRLVHAGSSIKVSSCWLFSKGEFPVPLHQR